MKSGVGNPMYGRNNDKHPNWKGNKASYYAIHLHLRKNNPQPESCQNCGLFTSRLDIANMTGIYDRDFKNYRYLCKKCHNKFDAPKRIIDKSNRECHHCHSTKTYLKKNGWVYWYRIEGKLTCGKCYCKYRRHLRGIGHGLLIEI